MVDITDVSIETFSTESAAGAIVSPASDTKKVIIPSPPSTQIIPINPRPAIIYLTDRAVSDELKAYAKENKLVFIVPEKTDSEGVCEVYTWVFEKARKLNIQKDNISVKADAANLDLAKAAVELIQEDYEVEDTKIFEY